MSNRNISLQDSLNDQLSARIATLEQVSALQSGTLLRLRDSSRIAGQKVAAAVNEIEKSMAGAVPGFRLHVPAVHPQFQLEPPTAIRAGFGFCPNCASTDVRRASRSGFYQAFLRLFFITPFRCRSCRHKFYRF
jgi:hypothetical protein